MFDRILLEEEKMPAGDTTAVKTEETSATCSVRGKGWFKGSLGMAICCGAPILLVAAISFLGLSLGAIANGALSLVALLACPVAMFLMMRMMMKGKNEDQSSTK
jgi:hypothetical protein